MASMTLIAQPLSRESFIPDKIPETCVRLHLATHHEIECVHWFKNILENGVDNVIALLNSCLSHFGESGTEKQDLDWSADFPLLPELLHELQDANYRHVNC